MKKYILYIIILFITSLGCKNNKDDEHFVYENGGVVLTFDDVYVSNWLMADTLLQKYNWRASFGITLFNSLTETQLQGLEYLESQGHEIASHSLSHKDAIEYVKNNGLDAYLKDEVDSMNTLMNQRFRTVTSFVYPYGSHNSEIDEVMQNKFKILRGTTGSKKPPKNQDCYFNGSHVVYGWGIDKSYDHYSKELLTELLQYAKDNHLVLILYAHRVTHNVTIDYQVNISTLEYICKYVDNNNMKFLTLSELADL